MSNEITAYFKGRTGVAESVYQNDYGIVLNFDSIDLPAHFDCYFTVSGSDEAIPGVGADNMVTIPNAVLANPGKVEVHIPLHNGANDSEVEYVIYFKIIGRARPMDDGTPVQMTAIEHALALLQNPIGNIEDIVNEALAFTGPTLSNLQTRTTSLEADNTSNKARLGTAENDIDVLEARMDTFTNLDEGSTTGDAELIDGRVGADAVTYPNIGDAIRTQVTNLKSDFSQYIGASTILNLNMFENGSIDTSGQNSDYRKNARARNKTIVTAPFEFTLSAFNNSGVSTDFALSVYLYDSNGTYIDNSGWKHAGDTYTVPAGQAYRLLIMDFNRSAASDVIGVSELVNHVRTESKFSKDMLNVLSATISTNSTLITEGQDLTVLPVGDYVCLSAEIAQTLTNCPVSDGGFRLFIIERYNRLGKTSLLIKDRNIFVRFGSSSTEYLTWYRLSNTEDLKNVYDKISDEAYELERSLNIVKPNAYRYEKGSIDSQGSNSTYQAYKRARSISVEKALYDMLVKSDGSIFQYIVFYYNDAGEYVESTGWTYEPTRIPYGSNFRILFANLDAEQTTPVDLDAILSHFTFSHVNEANIILRNSKAPELLKSLKRHVHDLHGGSIARRLNHNDLFCIAHISDIHLDTVRYDNFIKFCDTYSNLIDSRICTGDFVNDPTDAQIAHMRDFETVKTVLWCDGNHERHGVETGLTRKEVYEKWGLSTWYQETGVNVPIGYTADTGRENYQGVFDYPLFYYKDFTDSDSISGYKIRLIVLNCCDARTDPSTSSQLPSYTTEQMKWFVDVLQDAATNDFAVIVAQHYMESSIGAGRNMSFYTRDNVDENEVLNPENGDITVVENIIDAFRKGSSYVATNIKVRPDDAENTKLSVNADFGGNPGQFLAWMVGHAHRDRIGYSANHPDQLILQVVDGSLKSTLDGIVNDDMSNNSDLPRIEGEKSEDAFNIYAFDPVNKLCKVMRIGSDLNDMMIPREYACFETEPIII